MMDTTETYTKMCEKAVKIQDSQKYKAYSQYGDSDSPSNNALILRSESFYAIHNKDGYYFESSFEQRHTWNSTVCGYIHTPQNIRGCAVRGDLPVAYTTNEVIWLPRQDQLQEMIVEEPFSVRTWNLDFRFSKFIRSGIYRSTDLSSMEQLWLAFVMKEKYNKIWVNGNWVKKEN